MRHTLSFVFLLLLSLKNVSGQYYNTGQDPASLRWKHIQTAKFDVIYPENYGQKGIDFARILDDSYSRMSSLFPTSKRRMPVVIHNFSTRSNGYVAWGPRRMELYPAPDQDAIPGNQNRLLSIHETTHVFEIEALNRGFSKVMSLFLGEQFTGAVSALLPLWYLEGNAVFTETLLSASGRGRNPSFQRELKAIAIDRGNYKYDKILNGSFRDHIPDHYKTGYQMTTWAMVRHDPSIWNKVLEFTGEQPFTLNPVNISLRKNAGLTKKRLYKETFDTLKNIWTKEVSGARSYEILNPQKHGKYINYYSPLLIGSDSIVAIKTSLSSTPGLVLITGGKEKVFHRTGYMYPMQTSFGGEKILWVEDRPDIRWENRDFRIIRLLDLKTGRTTSLKNRTRYLSASISPDGAKIAAIENTPENENKLVILDSRKKSVLISASTPGNSDIQRPQWSSDGKKITVIYLTEEGEGIMVYTPSNNSWSTLLKAGTADLQSSFLTNDTLFFVSSSSGTDNIWISTDDGSHQITNSAFGVRDVTAKGSKILFSNYSSAGNNVCTIAANTMAVDPVPREQQDIIDRFDKSVISESTPGKENYEPEPYRKWKHLFRFHSWMPFYADIDKIQTDPLSIRPGLTLMSQNTLSTLTTTLGYEYTKDKQHIFNSELTWYGWYPIINAKVNYGYRPAVVTTEPLTIQPGLRVAGDVSLPFSFSSGYFNQYLRLTLNAEYSNNVYPLSQGKYDFGQTEITGRIYFSNYSRSALRNIYPRWAQTIDINRVSAPFDKEIFGSSSFIRTAFFFPGFFTDHGLKIRLNGEIQKTSKFLFPNRVSFPRGFNNVFYPEGYHNIISDKLGLVTADYVFPVVYPDFNLASLVYLKRIRAGLFFDQAWGTGNRYYTVNDQGRLVQSAYHKYTETFRSYGVELLADFHVLRIPFMISGGVQAAWRSTKELPLVSAVFNMDLYGFSIGRK